MTNQKRLEEYLVGKKGYLKENISNGKVIMLSGKWGSGKTHFWQNIIATDALKKELNDKAEVYIYVSLYGKSSIEEIENDIFSQAYFSAIGGENFITKGFATFTKRMKRYGFSKVANGLREEQKDNIERTALSRLNNGGIICFDDFERKSKDIDLNDLFGFITQLTLNFKCKVVIILNDDVFKGEEKDIFSNVKEKTVSKYLMYNPSIKDLFDSIFDNEQSYRILDEYRDIILKTIEETKKLNARIYIQVLDNIGEWVYEKKTVSDDIIRCLILVNINFILYHTIVKELHVSGTSPYFYHCPINFMDKFMPYQRRAIARTSFNSYRDDLHSSIYNLNGIKEQQIENYINFSYENETVYKSIYFVNTLEISRDIDIKQFNKINNFIETGILIDE